MRGAEEIKERKKISLKRRRVKELGRQVKEGEKRRRGGRRKDEVEKAVGKRYWRMKPRWVRRGVWTANKKV